MIIFNNNYQVCKSNDYNNIQLQYEKVYYFFIFTSINAWVNMTSSTACDPGFLSWDPTSGKMSLMMLTYSLSLLASLVHMTYIFLNTLGEGLVSHPFCCPSSGLSDHGLDFILRQEWMSKWPIFWARNPRSSSTAHNQIRTEHLRKLGNSLETTSTSLTKIGVLIRHKQMQNSVAVITKEKAYLLLGLWTSLGNLLLAKWELWNNYLLYLLPICLRGWDALLLYCLLVDETCHSSCLDG